KRQDAVDPVIPSQSVAYHPDLALGSRFLQDFIDPLLFEGDLGRAARNDGLAFLGVDQNLPVGVISGARPAVPGAGLRLGFGRKREPRRDLLLKRAPG